MTDIAVRPLQRTELPPSRVGKVKPPLSLADRSGEIGFAFATARFAGDRFNDVVKAKAENEYAAFQGIAAAEMEAFNTFVVSKPGASFEELEAERNKMVARIEVAAKKATTKSAQQSNKNWMLQNKKNINAQTQTSMEAIRTQQALTEFNLHRKNLITKFKDNELTDLYAGQVESRLMTKEFANAQLASDLAIMDEAATKLAIDNASAVGFNAWQATVTLENPGGDKKTGFAAIQALEGPSGDDKALAESKLNVQVNNRRAEDKIKLEAQQEEDLANINQSMYIDKNYQNATALIQASNLSQREKGTLLKESDRRAQAVIDGIAERNDPVAVDKISTAIAQVGNDTLPLADAKQILNENRALLKSEKVIEFTEELNKAFDASVDTASARVRSDVRLRAVGKSESALDRLIEALVSVKPDDQRGLEERITTARDKFLLELNNFNRWEEAQRAWRRTNPDATPEQIQKEGERSWFTEFAGKDIERLRAEGGLDVEMVGKSIGAVLSTGKVLMRKPSTKRPASRGGGIIEGAVFQVDPKDVSKRLSDGWKKVNVAARKIKTQPPERIRMISPDGKTGTIPTDKVNQAISQGWKRL